MAQYVTDHQQLEILLTHRGDPWWEEVLLLYAGHTPDASPLLRKLLGDDGEEWLREDLFKSNLVLAGRCLTARPTLQQAFLWDEVISRLFDTLATTQYSLIREHCAEALAAIGGAEVNKRLLQLLADEQVDWGVRESIAAALGQIGERSVVPQLLALLSNEQVDWYVRSSVAEALGKLVNDEESIHVLIPLLQRSDIADAVHRALWDASRRIGLRILISTGPQGEEAKLVRW